MVWFMTQNKKSLLNVKEVTVKGRYIEGVVGKGLFGEWSKVLGKYDTKERATEVLEEISKKMEQVKGANIHITMPKN